MEGIGLYIILFIFYLLSTVMKKKQEAAKKAEGMDQKEGPAQKQVPDLVRELFGLPPENELEVVEEEEPIFADDILDEETPQFEEEYPYTESPPEEEDISHLTYDDLETVSEEAYVPEELPHDIDTFEDDKIPHVHMKTDDPPKTLINRKTNIYRNLKDSNALQDAIILTEILGKPKALRKE